MYSQLCPFIVQCCDKSCQWTVGRVVTAPAKGWGVPNKLSSQSALPNLHNPVTADVLIYKTVSIPHDRCKRRVHEGVYARVCVYTYLFMGQVLT